jgi:hypothetical protein
VSAPTATRNADVYPDAGGKIFRGPDVGRHGIGLKAIP